MHAENNCLILIQNIEHADIAGIYDAANQNTSHGRMVILGKLLIPPLRRLICAGRFM